MDTKMIKMMYEEEKIPIHTNDITLRTYGTRNTIERNYGINGHNLILSFDKDSIRWF